MTYAYVSNANQMATSTFYYKKYTVTSAPRNYYNDYFNTVSLRTYSPLYVYYLPPGLYFALGYYSVLYGRIYYDGYGYNFYYGQYGYYEYSVNPEFIDENLAGKIISIVVCLVVLVLIVVCSLLIRKK